MDKIITLFFLGSFILIGYGLSWTLPAFSYFFFGPHGLKTDGQCAEAMTIDDCDHRCACKWHYSSKTCISGINLFYAFLDAKSNYKHSPTDEYNCQDFQETNINFRLILIQNFLTYSCLFSYWMFGIFRVFPFPFSEFVLDWLTRYYPRFIFSLPPNDRLSYVSGKLNLMVLICSSYAFCYTSMQLWKVVYFGILHQYLP